MSADEVMVVRIYLSEGHKQLETLIKRLHDWEKVRGLTVFRGIAGYGDSGLIHTAKFTDLSLDLPVVVEFFDEPGKVQAIVEHLRPMIKPGHLIHWRAQVI